MKDLTSLRERYLQDSLPIRLGGIAANLARINSFSHQEAHREVIEYLLEESKWLIEWTARDADTEQAANLVELQLQLAQWQHQWNKIWEDPEQRQILREQSQRWSERILTMSGLLE